MTLNYILLKYKSNMIIDLHGLTEIEAYAELHAKLLSLDFDPFEEYLDIITGKGWGILKRITIEVVQEDNRYYEMSEHFIRVYKKQQDDDNDPEFNDFFNEYNKFFK